MPKARVAREPMVTRFIVKFRDGKVALADHGASPERMTSLSARTGTKLGLVRTMSLGATVLQAEAPMRLKEAESFAARMSGDPSVEWAVPDLPVKAFIEPSDGSYLDHQWNLFAPNSTFTSGSRLLTTTGGANLPAAWDVTKGMGATVALVDSGVTLTHPDLMAALLSGYDFVSSTAAFGLPVNFIENDTPAGRDSDATDPGDWITAAEKAQYPTACDDGNPGDTPSSWHGTHMAGIIAGQWGGTGPGTSTAGIAPDAKVVPVRALGKCGGSSSDVIDAVAWAAGLATSPLGTTLPANSNPAKIINLSLGSSASAGPCNTAYTTLTQQLAQQNVVLLVATGNEGAPMIGQPANCPGVIAVTSHVINGDNADYANVGPEVAISAPGGGSPTALAISPAVTQSEPAFFIWSTYLFGATTPTSTVSATDARSGPAIGGITGTSPATPHVTGAVALIRSVYPQSTLTQVRSYLRSSARPHPQGGYCNLTGGPSNLFRCGPGLLDVAGAVQLANMRAPGVDLGAAKVVAPNSTVSLMGTVMPETGRTVMTTTWSQTSGPTVTKTDVGAATSFQAPATGTVVLKLTVTDNTGVSGSDVAIVRVNSAPTSTAPAAQTVMAGQNLQVVLTASDADGDQVLFSPAAALPTGATLSFDGAFSWPSAGPAGAYTINYQVDDGIANPVARSFNVTVTAPAPAPAPAPSNGGGGGSLPLLALAGLGALSLARRLRRG